MGWILTGEWIKCIHCSLAKIKTETITKRVKFNIPKEMKLIKVEQKVEGTYLHFGIDISKGPGASYGGNKFWILIVDIKRTEDNGTDMSWSRFAKRKNDLVDVVENFFDMLEKKGKLVKLIEIKIRLENAGENVALQKELEQSKWNVKLSLQH